MKAKIRAKQVNIENVKCLFKDYISLLNLREREHTNDFSVRLNYFKKATSQKENRIMEERQPTIFSERMIGQSNHKAKQ